MAFELARAYWALAAPAAICAASVLLLSRAAPALGLVDVPGGRKAHASAVPLVGGASVFVALLACAFAIDLAGHGASFLLALAIVLAVGLWDDVAEIAPRIKLAAQVAACAVMIYATGVELHTVGDLLGWRPIGLSILAVPLTVFALVGVVNAVNMVDGMDGLGGSIALIAFAWYAAVAAGSGLDAQLETALAFCGAIAGFLLFNLHFPWQRHARAFLGDGGSLMIGFALGWFAIDLTQGPGRTFPPIAALWVLLLPLADCVSLMARRIRARRNPFLADRRHLHHYLLARGWSPGQVLGVLAGTSFAFGAVGYLAWRLEVPEPVLFWPFFAGYFAYHGWIQRAWRRLGAQGRAGRIPACDRRAPS